MDAVVLEAAVVLAHVGLPARGEGAWAQGPGACGGHTAERGEVGFAARSLWFRPYAVRPSASLLTVAAASS